jgi:hypothetical protein
MKKMKIAQLKSELEKLSRQQKKELKGGAYYVYGDGCCRDGYGGPIIRCGYPRYWSGYC